MPIEHISDTARWVAVYRAMETARTDAIFKDPYAERLAGERGNEIVKTIKHGRSGAWAMIVRTAVFDDIILQTVRREQVDLVLNLAAGLDARAWRLPLPPALRWIDVDFPAMLNYKTEILAGETPVCKYETFAADLTSATERASLLSHFGSAGTRIMVITEGLLVYLSAEQVQAFAGDLCTQPTIRWWLTDLASPRLLVIMNRYWGRDVTRGNAPFQFAPAEGPAFFLPLGWNEAECRYSMEEARRLNREMSGMWFWRAVGHLYPKRMLEEFRKMSSITLLERA